MCDREHVVGAFSPHAGEFVEGERGGGAGGCMTDSLSGIFVCGLVIIKTLNIFLYFRLFRVMSF